MQDEKALQQFVFYGVPGHSTARGDSQLAVDRAHMRIDGDQADDESLSDLRTGQALGKQVQHFHLPNGQALGIGRCGLHW